MLLLLLSRISIDVTAKGLWQADVRSLYVDLLSALPLAALVLVMHYLALGVQELLLGLRLHLSTPD